MLIYKSIANDEIIPKFSKPYGDTLFNVFGNTCNVEQAISCASVFWPEIIEVDGYVFISDLYQGYKGLDINKMKKRNNSTRKEIERRINATSVSGLFLLTQTDSLLDDEIFSEFCNILKFFWELRFKMAFPGKTFVVELGYELYGENGTAITVYQEDE